VTQQIVTSDRLIKAENQMLRDAASKAIPLPTSPNKEATRVALAAQSIHVSMQHQHIQASRVIFVKPKPQKQKQKIQKKKKVQKGGSPSNTGGRGSPVIVDKEDNVPSLDVAALSWRTWNNFGDSEKMAQMRYLIDHNTTHENNMLTIDVIVIQRQAFTPHGASGVLLQRALARGRCCCRISSTDDYSNIWIQIWIHSTKMRTRDPKRCLLMRQYWYQNVSVGQNVLTPQQLVCYHAPKMRWRRNVLGCQNVSQDRFYLVLFFYIQTRNVFHP
jgi:hypothetical protein